VDVARKLEIDEGKLAARLDGLPGIEVLRSLADKVPAYLVGGAVRDLLLGLDRADLDVVIEGDVRALDDAPGVVLADHERFLTARLGLDGHQIDIAQARTETYPRPGALPEVAPAKIEQDLARRDFTINAMAIPLRGEPRLLDPHGGLADLPGLLRVLHDRSFVDDPTRALRAARYCARLDAEVEPRTLELLRAADLSTVSADRVDAELRRIATEPAGAAAIRLVADWGLVGWTEQTVELALEVLEVVAQPAWRRVAEAPDAFLAALGRAPGAADAVEAAERLARVEPERPSQAVFAARSHPGIELVLARAMGAEWLDRYVTDWRGIGLEIDGNDLVAAGVAEGPAVGRGLDAALSATLDGEISGREEQLRIAVQAALGEIPED